LFSILCFSQEEIYLDENMKEIDSLQYSKRCTFQIFKCLEYKTDSLIINKVLYKYSFGKIEPKEYEQIRKLLIRDSKTKIEAESVLVINYYNSINSYNTIYRKHLKNYVKPDSANSKVTNKYIVRHDYTLKDYKKNKMKWVKTKNKCIKRFEKVKNTKILFIYQNSEVPVNSYLNFNWIKDYGLFKNKFFKIKYQNSLLVIKPDGEYFLSGSHFSDKNVNKLLKHSDWTKYKKDWVNTIHKNLSSGVGMFKRESLYYHKSHCF